MPDFFCVYTDANGGRHQGRMLLTHQHILFVPVRVSAESVRILLTDVADVVADSDAFIPTIVVKAALGASARCAAHRCRMRRHVDAEAAGLTGLRAPALHRSMCSATSSITPTV